MFCTNGVKNACDALARICTHLILNFIVFEKTKAEDLKNKNHPIFEIPNQGQRNHTLLTPFNQLFYKIQ